jgi:hypothetical protein
MEKQLHSEHAISYSRCDCMTQSGTTAVSIAKQEGHTSLSDELHKGKSKKRIRTQNPFEYVSVGLN